MNKSTRRSFLNTTALIAGSVCLNPLILIKTACSQEILQKEKQVPEEEISPVEDLMREHGLLNRLLLIYDNVAMKLANKQDIDLKILAEACEIMHSFIESYHEKLEEDYVFPHLEKANKFTDLVKVLREQHKVGKNITSEISCCQCD